GCGRCSGRESCVASRAGLAGAAGLGEAGEVDPASLRAVKAPTAQAWTGDEEGPARCWWLQAEAGGDVIIVGVFVARIRVRIGPAQQLDAVRPARAADLEAAGQAQLATMDAARGDGVLEV